MSFENSSVPSRPWKADLSTAGKVFVRTLLAAAMGFFVFMSIEMLFSGIFTKHIGYHIYRTDGGVPASTVEDLGEFYSADMEQVYAQLAEMGYVVDGTGTAGENAETIYITSVKLYSTLSPALQFTSRALSQLCMLLIFVTLVYAPAWTLGDKDCNRVQFERATADPWRGLRIGLLASVPALLAYLVLVASKLGWLLPNFVQHYRFCHFAFFPLYLALVPNEITLTVDLPWLNILALLPLILSVPAITAIGYRLGDKQISVAERLVFVRSRKNKKRR